MMDIDAGAEQHEIIYVDEAGFNLCKRRCRGWNRDDDGSSFNEKPLIACLLDLLFAGTDTISNTLPTAFLHLLTHPDVQGEITVVFLCLFNAPISPIPP
ncbi:hypothetical protein SKAU_G00378300 [Synaphobranchus kaupii]|uniref:Uncharacterized protein n=1 Tax=Synaphobranchus kaupii TaxID=118154 RepID=A0A9Q1ED51_SYNKA|nr:hypothetical protein SKAU_G00378300 [Synaphobranchus kaupii]